MVWNGFLNGTNLSREFESDLGDPRRTSRLTQIGEKVAETPDAFFLDVFTDGAELEGFYRFIRNGHVDFDAVLSAHRGQTVERAAQYDEVLVIHDTTEFRLPKSAEFHRDNLHVFSSTAQGFRGHFTFVSSADGLRAPLGVLGMRGYVPPSAEDSTKEFWNTQFGELVNLNDRWFDAIEKAEQSLGNKVSAIHVADREADIFSLVQLMDERDYQFVVRANHNRRINKRDAAEKATLEDALVDVDFVASRTIDLSARSIGDRPPQAKKKNPPRKRRSATLHFRFAPVEILPPPDPEKSTAQNQPNVYRTVHLTVIEAVELEPPEGETAIRWLLLTSQEVDNIEQTLKVVDQYRGRWQIEELFKSIKTGCAFEKRQMGSATTLLIALAILIPVAWRLLLIRHLARHLPKSPFGLVATELEVKILRAKIRKPKLPKKPSAEQVCAAIAQLGGHQKRNGPPGWLVLGRGFQKLAMMVEGYQLLSEDL